MTAGRKNSQNNQHWNTPSKYVSLVHEFFENFLDFDPCSNHDSIVNSKIKITLPEDGLAQKWDYKTIYINPPWGRDFERKTSIADWIEKAYLSYEEYGSEILMLIPVATNTSYWKKYIFGKASICFLYDTRLVFRINGKEENKGSPVACCFIYYGRRLLRPLFSKYGYVVS